MKTPQLMPSAARRLTRLFAIVTGVVAIHAAPFTASAQIEVQVGTTQPGSAETTATQDPQEAPELKQDSSADQAAQKIVPAPGTQMQSTEGGSLLPDAGAVAAEPSLKVDADQVVLKDGQSTEALAVSSGAELLKLLGLQRNKQTTDGPSELDESTTSSLFDVEAIRRLKGTEPIVVYRVVINDTPLPDPMIVPWIRQAKLLQERFDKAVQLLGENKVDDGRQELLAIVADFPDTDYATQARALLGKLDDLSKPLTVPTAPVDEEKTTVTVELSPNVQIGTVIVDPQNPTGNRAMIGGRAYKVGDPISGIPNHKVVSISENVVQIEVQQSGVTQIFDVPVRPRGATE